MNKMLATVLVCGVHALHAQTVRCLATPPEALQPGVALEIRLSGVPTEEADAFNAHGFIVRANGAVTLPHVGQVQVEGLTMSQAERAIERAYVAQKIYRWPSVTVQPFRSSRSFQQRHRWLPDRPLDAPGPGYREHVQPQNVL